MKKLILFILLCGTLFAQDGVRRANFWYPLSATNIQPNNYKITLSDGTDKFSIGTASDALTFYNDAGSPAILFSIDSVGKPTFTNQLIAPLGSAAAPAYAFTGFLNAGFYADGSGFIYVSQAGVARFSIQGSDLYFTAEGALKMKNGTVILDDDANDALGLRRTTNPQTFNIYSKYLSASSYRRAANYWSADSVYHITQQNAGAYSQRGLVFDGWSSYSFDGGNITTADPGTTANSYSISLVADNSTTNQTGTIQVMYGADPYLRFSAPNDAGTATAIMDLKDTRVVIGASGSGIDYDLYFQGESNQGSITYMEDEDRFDFAETIKLAAELNQTPGGDDTVNDSATIDVTGHSYLRVIGGDADATGVGLEDGTIDGQRLLLQGVNDSNLVTLTDNTNCQLSGGNNFSLGKGDTIELIWDAGDSDWYELSRSDN